MTCCFLPSYGQFNHLVILRVWWRLLFLIFATANRLEVSSLEALGLLLRLLPKLSVQIQTRACADLVR